MSAEILVVYAYLDTLASHADRAAAALDGGSTLMNLDFTGNPEVTAAYDDMVGDWDKHRDRLAEALKGVSEAFRAVRDAFGAVEDDLIAQLND